MSTNPPRLTITHPSLSQSNHSNVTSTVPTPMSRSTIEDFHEGIREPSNYPPEVAVRKYSPLPNISTLSTNERLSRTESSYPKSKAKKQIFNHFAHSQRQKLTAVHSSQNTSVINAMDLDEDLPQYSIESNHRAATYTSPGERIISPIKRPSAPSPPTSAQIQRANVLFNNDEDEDDDDDFDEHEEMHSSRLEYEDSQIFNENFYHYPPPIIMNNRRIDHYNLSNRSTHNVDRNPTIVVNDGYDQFHHPLDRNDYEP